MDLSTADDILKRVRVFYAGGHTVRRYWDNTSNAEAVSYPDMQTHANTQKVMAEIDPDELLQKDVKRANNADLARTNRPRVSAATVNRSRYEKGQIIYASSNYASGNCGEMACIVSHPQFRSSERTGMKVWIGTITKPGDHVFCLVGPKPAAKSVEHMNNSSFVIDRWLNTACTASKYEHRARVKFWKWHKQGKRIAFTGSVGTGLVRTGGL